MQSVCIHRLPEIEPGALPDFKVVACTSARRELLAAVKTLDVAAVLLNLDEADAVATIIEMLEVKPGLGLVGVTDGSNAKRMIEAQRAGCAQFATRPIDADDLGVALRQSLSQGSAATIESHTIAVLGTTGGAG